MSGPTIFLGQTLKRRAHDSAARQRVLENAQINALGSSLLAQLG